MPISIQLDNHLRSNRQFLFKTAMSQQHIHLAVIDHVGKAVLWKRRIERYVCTAAFQDAKNSRQHVQRTLDAKPDQHAGFNAQFS